MSIRQALILMAHADDETLCAGGIIQKLVKSGWDVKVVITSDGVHNVRGVVTSNREDCVRACRLLGGPDPVFLDFPGQRFDTVAIADLANGVANLKLSPDLIVTHAGTDLNNDHRLVFEMAKIIGRPKLKPVSILCGECPSTTFWNGTPFQANYYVKLTPAEVSQKVHAFSAYKNELMAYPHPWSSEGLKLLAQYHGMQSGYEYAEAFHLVRGYEGLLP